MKLYTFILILFFTAGCSPKQHKHLPANQDNDWPAMDAFHMIMAETFHPYQDSGDLGPVKLQAEELKIQAVKWAQSPIPVRVDNYKIKAGIDQLISKASALATLVKTGNDKDIATALVELHDLFHEIQSSWYSADEEKNEHHH